VLTGDVAQIVEGRSCGKCSLCCKVMQVKEIAKQPGSWCKDCAPGKGGCKIYQNRPAGCRDFLCGWLLTKELGPAWFPAAAKLVVQAEEHRVTFLVDPAFPNRWREEPYYSLIRSYAREMVDLRQVFVWIGKRLIAVLPNKEIDLGEVEVDDHIMVEELNVPPGHLRDWSAHVEKAGKIPPEDRDKRAVNGPH
jgi:hypothetical protein